MRKFPALTNLPPAVSHEILANLCRALPPPRSEAPEDRASRDETAMMAVAALSPCNAFEALLAAQIIVADAHVKESLRRSVDPEQSPESQKTCGAQASSMMRQMQSGLRALLRIQAKREKGEASMHPAAMQQAGYWFRDVSVPAAPAEAADATASSEPPATTDRADPLPPDAAQPTVDDGATAFTEYAESFVNRTDRMLLALDRASTGSTAT